MGKYVRPFFLKVPISGFETIQKENETLFNASPHLNFDKTAGIHYSIEKVQMLKHTLGVSE